MALRRFTAWRDRAGSSLRWIPAPRQSSASSREPRSSPFRPSAKFKDVRSLDVRESDKIDEKQLATWIKQAASIPGWDGGSTRYGGPGPGQVANRVMLRDARRRLAPTECSCAYVTIIGPYRSRRKSSGCPGGSERL